MSLRLSWLVVALLLCLAPPATHAAEPGARRLVTQSIDDARSMVLPGNVRPEAKAANDGGRVSDALSLQHMQLLLRRPDERESALKQFLSQVQNPKSTQYHRWLTATQFGARFGPAADDVQDVAYWLRSHGFVVNGVQANRMVIDFSGSAGAVRNTFATEIHRLRVSGGAHIANMRNPRIPAALAGVVRGIVSLHDFRPHVGKKPRPAYSFFGSGSIEQAVVPADLATIYGFNPLFQIGLAGQGQTVVVIEDSDVYDAADWSSFRSALGLAGYSSGALTQVHPASATQSCADPGVVAGTESEAILDAEWASAAAPAATIEVAACADTDTTFGGLIALQNLLDGSAPPAIVSISYGECEAYNGAAANAAYEAAYQQAAAMGVSVFVSTGDEGAASCDAGQTSATHGVGVSGLASTPYNVAVGGTDFTDSYSGTVCTYWSPANSDAYGSALSYIPEMPWNNSCASAVLTAAAGYYISYGEGGFCNSQLAEQNFLTTTSGSGGPSGCATGAPDQSGVVGGTCQGYAKPSWQSLVGNPSDQVRDLPDVSMFAANGLWGHYFVYCDSDIADGGAACTGAPSGWSGAGGTSFGAPILAGIQALVNQNQGARQGNPNPVYYAIAGSNYGPSGSIYCISGLGYSAADCAFNDIVDGDIDVNCTGATDCYQPGGANGVLSTSSSSDQPAYAAGVGWDFATGIGSVNALNLVRSWTAGEQLAGSATSQ